jgi:propanol-preferring alcohol dehydrogenase
MNAGTAGRPGKMRAAVLRQLKTRLKIERLPIPEPGPGEILVKVAACGVCHSDLHAIDGDWATLPVLPLIPGHEVTGHVAALGPGVPSQGGGGFRQGDAVGVPWMWSACGHCEACLDGMETVCRQGQATGYSRPGGYAEYMVARADFVARLPQHADLVAIAPILCAGVTTYRGLKRTQTRPGQWVAVVGVGGLGHIAVQYAVAMGLRVAAVDIDPKKLALAKQSGAEFLVDAREGNPVSAIRKGIGGVHGAVVAAVATQAFEQSIGMLRLGGSVVFLGLPGGKADELRASIAQISGRELSVRGSSLGTRLDLQEAVDFALRGAVKAKVETAPLSAANAVLNRMRRGKIVGRVVLTMA